MTNKISQLFGVKLSKNGKQQIEKWINDEYGSMYHAKNSLETDQDVIDFINDMLKEENITINELCDNRQISRPNKKQYKYCPYCGERIN